MKKLIQNILLITVIVNGHQAVFAQSPRTFEQYVEERKQLLQRDSQLYFDHGIELNEQEQTLNQHLVALQRQMLDQYQAKHFFPPARNFYNSKAHIEGSTLFQIIRKMPKGGMLHIHGPAIGDPDWILNRARETPEMYVYWGNPTAALAKGQLRAFRAEEVPSGFIQVKDFLDQNPEHYQALRSLLVFEEAMDQDSVDIWGEFQVIFQRIDGFVSYHKVYADYITHGLELLIEDNIQHAEIRTGFRDKLYHLGQEADSIQIDSFVLVLEQIDKRIRQKDPEFTWFTIHSSLRFKNAATIWKEILRTYEYRKKFPEWVRGFDLVAEEDAGNSTLYHAPQFLGLDSIEAIHGVSLPLYLHDGESNWASVDNLYDAVLLGTKRIGHGFNLFRFPNLLEEVKKQDICLEISPLSNQILGYVRDLRNHPGSTYLRRGIHLSISSDDPMIFDYHGLSYDYWSIFLAWELDLGALKQLSQNGINYSAMTPNEKARAMTIWQQRWDQFVTEALNHFEN